MKTSRMACHSDLDTKGPEGRRHLLSTTMLVWVLTGTLGITVPAMAQEAETTDDAIEMEDIVITGSRIRRSATEMPTPTTIISSDAIEISGSLNIGDLLLETPQVGSFSASNENTSFSFFNGGLNSAALRNLGEQRTLTLINGHRGIGTADDQNFFLFDMSTVPTDLIERIEVITGGASAVYGADAVAGVINIILKDDFEGMTTRAYGGISNKGDRESYKLSTLAGFNFDGDRGNAIFSVEYSDQEGLFFRDRDNAGGSVRFVSNPENTGPEDGIPDQIMDTNLRFVRFGINNTTVELFRNLDGTPANVNNIFSFRPDGTTFLAIPGEEIIDGFLTKNEFGGPPGATDLAIIPLERYNAYSRLTYDLFENVRFTGDLRYSRTKSEDIIGPGFAILSGFDRVSADNPFVPDSLKTILAGDPNTPDDDITDIFFSRQFAEFGPRMSEVDREFFSFSVGLDGELANGWTWDVYYQWGGTSDVITQRNDLQHGRYTQALDAIVDPVSGEIVCRDQSNGCVPLNVFGPAGTVTQEMVDFLVTDHTTTRRGEQKLLSISLSGDLFELPAGEVGFAIGAEYREDSLDFKPSFVWENALGFFQSQFSPVKASTDVYEVFGEFLVPVIKDAPLIKDLSIEGAMRIADYKNAGRNTSWKMGASWQIVDDIRFRGVYARAVRAPSLGELFDPGSRGAQGLSDPCDALQVTANANRQANCAALGIPSDFVSLTRSFTTLVFSTGNEELEVEKADTLTLGAVFTPTFLDNFALTVDYYDIDLKDGITRFGAQNTLDLCVDLPDLNNNFCDAVTRGPDHNIVEVRDTFINASGFFLKGIDFSARYRLDMEETFDVGGNLYFGVIGSYLADLKFKQVLNSDDNETKENAGEAGDPTWRVTFDATYNNGPLRLNWQTRFISGVANNNDDSPEFRDPARIPSAWYHDLFAGYQITESFELSGGINNVFDKAPPLHPFTASGANLYPITGRFFWLQATYHFN